MNDIRDCTWVHLAHRSSALITVAVDNGDDEALMVIAQKLGDFVPLVGGGSYAGCLLVRYSLNYDL